jgi:hypothetical protein
MTEITIQQAWELLQRSKSVIHNNCTANMTLIGLQDDESNEFMYISNEDEDDETYTSFFEGNNAVTIINKNDLYFFTEQGKAEKFTLICESESEAYIISRETLSDY